MRRSLRFCGWIGLAALALAGREPASPPDLAALLAMPVASGLVAGPGGRFAWIVDRNGARNLWVAEAGTGGRQLTGYADDDGEELSDIAFAPAGRTIAYVRGGDPEYPNGAPPNPLSLADPPRATVHVVGADGRDRLAGEGHAPAFSPDGGHLAFASGGALFVAGADGAGARRLTAVRGTIGQLGWLPDGRGLLFAVNRGDHTLLATADAGTGAIRFLDPGFGEVGDPCVSPDGRAVAYIRAVWPPVDAPAGKGAYWSIRVVDLTSGAARTVWAAPPGAGGRYAPGTGRDLWWTDDGELVFSWERTGWRHLYAVPAAGGSPRALTAGALEVAAFALDRPHRAVVFEGNAGDLDHHGLWRVPLAGGPPQRLGAAAADLARPVVAPDGSIAAIATDATHPARPVLVAGARTRALFGTDADYAAAQGFAAPAPVLVTAADGTVVDAQLFRPRRGSGRHPALVFVHGGPRRQMLPGFNQMGYYSNAYLMNQHLADEGYMVLSVNYRGGTGYGAAFRDAAGKGAAGAAEYGDVRAAARWLAGRSDVDPKRIGLWGGSWGGYLTALGLARDGGLFAAGVDFHGDVDLTKPDDVDVNGLSPDAAHAALATAWAASPAAAMAGWRAPVLVIHGDDDRNVLFAQSVVLVRWLQEYGVSHEELVLPDERHAFLRTASWLAAYRAADGFLARRLRP